MLYFAILTEIWAGTALLNRDLLLFAIIDYALAVIGALLTLTSVWKDAAAWRA